MKKRNRLQMLFEYITDSIALAAATLVSYFLFGVVISKIPAFRLTEWAQYIVLLYLSYTIVFLCFTSPITLDKRSKIHEAGSVFRNCSLTYLIFAALLLLIKNSMVQSRFLYLGSFIFFILLSSIMRYILKRELLYGFSKCKMATLVGIITVSNRADNFVGQLKDDWSKKITGVALMDCDYQSGHYVKLDKKSAAVSSGGNVDTAAKQSVIIDSVAGVDVVADKNTIIEWTLTASLDEVYINLPLNMQKAIIPCIQELEDMGIIVHINLANLEQIAEDSNLNNMKCDIVADTPMASFTAAEHNATLLFLKRLMDIIGSLLGLLISIPVIAVVAIPLLLESKGGLFFKQQRVGKNGRIFNIYKLRSMYSDAEARKCELECQNTMNGQMFKIDDDPRITKIGKFIRKTSIDELPQFFNVLKGDMSIVGTRPPTLDEFVKYQNHHKRRLSMRPGITGNWQVSGRSDIHDFEDVVKLDCDYIDNWSLALDIKIIFKTIPAVLCKNGAK